MMAENKIHGSGVRSNRGKLELSRTTPRWELTR